jgi:hypothetical protein
MTKKYLLIILTALIWLVGCTNRVPLSSEESISLSGSGRIAVKEFELSAFDQIETGLPFEVILSQDEEYQVEVHADDNFIDYVDLEVQGTTLTMGFKPGIRYDLKNISLRVEVSMPKIKVLNLSGSSLVTLDNFTELEDLEVSLNGASSLGGKLEASELVIDASSNAKVNLAGSVSKLSISADGNSLVDLKDLKSKQASIEASGLSQVVVNVLDVLEISASQHSQIYYYGNPDLGEISVNQFSKVAAMDKNP